MQILKERRLTILGRGGVIGGGVERMQHLFTPGGEAILRLHPLQEFQQPILLLSAFTAPHHVLLTVQTHTNGLPRTHTLDCTSIALTMPRSWVCDYQIALLSYHMHKM